MYSIAVSNIKAVQEQPPPLKKSLTIISAIICAHPSARFQKSQAANDLNPTYNQPDHYSDSRD